MKKFIRYNISNSTEVDYDIIIAFLSDWGIDAFEELECYVNAYYIYYRIMLDDATVGEKYFHQFYKRNLNVLDQPDDGKGAVHR